MNARITKTKLIFILMFSIFALTPKQAEAQWVTMHLQGIVDAIKNSKAFIAIKDLGQQAGAGISKTMGAIGTGISNVGGFVSNTINNVKDNTSGLQNAYNAGKSSYDDANQLRKDTTDQVNGVNKQVSDGIQQGQAAYDSAMEAKAYGESTIKSGQNTIKSGQQALNQGLSGDFSGAEDSFNQASDSFDATKKSADATKASANTAKTNAETAKSTAGSAASGAATVGSNVKNYDYDNLNAVDKYRNSPTDAPAANPLSNSLNSIDSYVSSNTKNAQSQTTAIGTKAEASSNIDVNTDDTFAKMGKTENAINSGVDQGLAATKAGASAVGQGGKAIGQGVSGNTSGAKESMSNAGSSFNAAKDSATAAQGSANTAKDGATGLNSDVQNNNLIGVTTKPATDTDSETFRKPANTSSYQSTETLAFAAGSYTQCSVNGVFICSDELLSYCRIKSVEDLSDTSVMVACLKLLSNHMNEPDYTDAAEGNRVYASVLNDTSNNVNAELMLAKLKVANYEEEVLLPQKKLADKAADVRNDITVLALTNREIQKQLNMLIRIYAAHTSLDILSRMRAFDSKAAADAAQ